MVLNAARLNILDATPEIELTSSGDSSFRGITLIAMTNFACGLIGEIGRFISNPPSAYQLAPIRIGSYKTGIDADATITSCKGPELKISTLPVLRFETAMYNGFLSSSKLSAGIYRFNIFLKKVCLTKPLVGSRSENI